MNDGVYQVTYQGVCAGFVVRGGVVVECAPVLRKRLEWWVRQAVLVAGVHGSADRSRGLPERTGTSASHLPGAPVNPYSQYLDQIDSVKPAGPGYAPRLPDGTHDIVLTRFDGKPSDQNKGIIFEADFVVEGSTDQTVVGQKRGWPFWPQSQGWAAAHEARRWGSFTAAIDTTTGRTPARAPREVGNDLFTGMYRGIRLRAVVTPRFNKDGTRMFDKKGKPVSDIDFSVLAPQSMQEIQAKAATLPPEPIRPATQQFQGAPHPAQMAGQYPAQQQQYAPPQAQSQYAQPAPQQYAQPPMQQPQYAQPAPQQFAQPQYAPPQAQPQYAQPAPQQFAPPQAQPQYPQQPMQGQPGQPVQGQPGQPQLGGVLAGLRNG